MPLMDAHPKDVDARPERMTFDEQCGAAGCHSLEHTRCYVTASQAEHTSPARKQ
jgi:hypothetical protein